MSDGTIARSTPSNPAIVGVEPHDIDLPVIAAGPENEVDADGHQAPRQYVAKAGGDVVSALRLDILDRHDVYAFLHARCEILLVPHTDVAREVRIPDPEPTSAPYGGWVVMLADRYVGMTHEAFTDAYTPKP